jgi:hypothetical protein
MSARTGTPGLQRKANKDGTNRLAWVARSDLRKLGYKPSFVKLDHLTTEEQLSAECHRLQDEMLAWAQERRASLVYDGTVGSLVRWYETAEDSPYRDLKPTTAVTYKKMLKPLLAGKAALLVEDITGADVRRWFKELQVGRSLGSAYLAINIFKAVLAFGSSNRVAPCTRLRQELRDTRFESPPARETELTYPQLVAFRQAAIAAGRPSMALGVTLQFELGMRQKDVIGEWVDAPGVDGIHDKKAGAGSTA